MRIARMRRGQYTAVIKANGTQVLYHIETPIAARAPDGTWYRAHKDDDSRTSKMARLFVNMYLRQQPVDKVEFMSQAALEGAVEKL